MKYTLEKSLETTAAYDVIVTGGGTAGVVAAIAAARNGAKTLLVEKSGSLGGMMTVGNCGLTCYILHSSKTEDQYVVEQMLADDPRSVQVIGGLPMEITNRLIKSKSAVATEENAGSYVFADQTEFKTLLNDLIIESGAHVLFHTSFIEPVMDDKRIKGIVVHNKAGLTLYEGNIFIDATGDGDLAAGAGAEQFTGVGIHDLAYEENPEVLGEIGSMGVMFRIGSTDIKKALEYIKDRKKPPMFKVQIMAQQDYDTVIDYIKRGQMTTFVISGFSFGGLQIYNTPDPDVFILGCPCISGNGLIPEERSAAELKMTGLVREFMSEIYKVPGFENAMVLDIPEIGIRETRHIIGEYILGLKDILMMKKFDDSIGRGSHLIDISPVPSWLKKDELPDMFEFTIPYRSIIVKDIDNLFVAGRCISATHEASGTIRVTVQCMVTGEAAGTAAAICIEDKQDIREVKYIKVRDRLFENGVVL